MKRLMREIKEWTKSFVLAILIFVVLTTFGDITQVYGQSMEPTLHQKDQLVYSKFSDVEKGDVVIVRSEIELTEAELSKMNIVQRWKIGDFKPLLKRVIATTGDQVLIKNGVVYINEIEIEESYIGNSSTPGDVFIEEIPEGYYFVMGDNRHNSLDSRSAKVGLVSEVQIEGEVFVRLFPLTNIGLL